MEFDKKILIVDDEKFLRKLLISSFRGNNYKCLEAENGQEALDLLEKCSSEIFLVIVDIMMPIMNGMDFLKIAKPKYPDIEFIILTAASTEQTVVEALEYGATNYSTKPLNLDELKFITEKLKQNFIIRYQNSLMFKELENNKAIESTNFEYKIIAEELRLELARQERAFKRLILFVKENAPQLEIPIEFNVYIEKNNNLLIL